MRHLTDELIGELLIQEEQSLLAIQAIGVAFGTTQVRMADEIAACHFPRAIEAVHGPLGRLRQEAEVVAGIEKLRI